MINLAATRKEGIGDGEKIKISQKERSGWESSSSNHLAMLLHTSGGLTIGTVQSCGCCDLERVDLREQRGALSVGLSGALKIINLLIETAVKKGKTLKRVVDSSPAWGRRGEGKGRLKNVLGDQ